ncbi:MAG: hypothetical protein NVSMB56_16570 [Pyrinomonadaceae bacterium]
MARVILYGSDYLALPVLEQLQSDRHSLTVIALPDSWFAGIINDDAAFNRTHAPPALNVSRLLHTHSDVIALLHEAEIEKAEILFAVTSKDELNLGMALAALELNENVRVVLRQFNLRLGKLIEGYLPRCEVLSMSTLAAPTFALAALTPGVIYAQHFGAQIFLLRETSAGEIDMHGRQVIASPQTKIIAASDAKDSPSSSINAASSNNVTSSASDSRLLTATLIASKQDVPPSPFSTSAPPNKARKDARESHRVLTWTLAYLIFIVALATFYFHFRLGLKPLDALYFVVTIITTVGFGDFSLREADALSKIVGIVVMISGVALTAVLFALVTNALLAKQKAIDLGRVRRSNLRDHTIVCGLGSVGFRVASELQRLGQKVVAIERDETNRFIVEARREGIQVVVGDSLAERSLFYANAPRAKSLIVCANPDYLNLEIALFVRSLHKDLPIVLRLFDPDLSRRVAHHFKLATTFSSARLVAPGFIAESKISTLLHVGKFNKLKFEIHQVTVHDGETIDQCRRRHTGEIVAVVNTRDKGSIRFSVEHEEPLSASDALILIRFAG